MSVEYKFSDKTLIDLTESLYQSLFNSQIKNNKELKPIKD